MLGRNENDRYAADALRYLRATQKPAGHWFGRWGVNHIYGTWCVVSALAQMNAGRDMILRAVQWLVSMQNADGGWGETCHSYADESFAGVGTSTPLPIVYDTIKAGTFKQVTLQFANVAPSPPTAAFTLTGTSANGAISANLQVTVP